MYFEKKKISILLVTVLLITFFYIPKEAAAKVSQGSTVAGIELEGHSIEEAKRLVEEMIETWKAGSPLIAINDYEMIEIPRNLFIFDLDTTFEQLEEKMQRNWSRFF